MSSKIFYLITVSANFTIFLCKFILGNADFLYRILNIYYFIFISSNFKSSSDVFMASLYPAIISIMIGFA